MGIWPESPPPPVATAVPIATATELVSVTTQPVSAMAIPMGTAVATNSNECVVCFKTYVDTCLRPCGHIAMCRACATRTQTCPICRTPISSIDPIPTATAALDTSFASATPITPGTGTVPMATAVFVQ